MVVEARRIERRQHLVAQPTQSILIGNPIHCGNVNQPDGVAGLRRLRWELCWDIGTRRHDCQARIASAIEGAESRSIRVRYCKYQVEMIEHRAFISLDAPRLQLNQRP